MKFGGFVGGSSSSSSSIIMMIMTTTVVATCFLLPTVTSFCSPPLASFTTRTQQQQQRITTTTTTKGWTPIMMMSHDAKESGESTTSTTTSSTTSTSMTDFFSEHVDWHPLFRSMSAHETVPAMIHLIREEGEGAFKDNDDTTTTTTTTTAAPAPWNVSLDAIPSKDEDKQVIGAFLDQMQQSLLELPTEVGYNNEEDEDMPFILEGRRLLAITRFQVIRSCDTSSSSSESLFSVCWNELAQLSRDDQPDTGSLIILPDYYNSNNDDDDDDDTKRRTKNTLQHFLTTKMEQPLQWLGLDPYFEITHLQYGKTGSSNSGDAVPALRLLHKLSDVPTLPDRNKENYHHDDDDDDDDDE